MSENDKVGNLKNNPSSEKLEISVKTFFGHELKVIANTDGSYSITTSGLKGLIDKILLPIFSEELDARKAEIEESLKNNNSSTNEKTKSNNGDEQDSHKTITTSDDLNKTNQSLSEKNTKMANNSYDSNFQLLSNKKDSIGNQTNINNDNRNNSSIKERESGNIDNEFSIFNNKDNKINFVDGQNSARTDVNNMCHNSSILSKEELNEIEGQINDLRKVGDYTEETLALLKQNLIEEAIEKKKSGKENLEYQRQLEKVIEQSKSESENTDKRYKEAENNLKKIIPEGYRVTSFDKGDEIIGDGNCFYRAIAKLEKGNQEEYGDVRKKIFDEIGKYCPESNEEQAEKIDNNLKDLIENYAVENKLECSLNEVDDLLAVLIQIREHVGNADNKNRYAGHIEAYFYAKATKNAVIIYDSIGQMTAFIPDKEGKDMQVKSLSAKETEDQQKIENFVKNNSINVAAAVKLACNTVGPHYEAIVPVDVKN